MYSPGILTGIQYIRMSQQKNTNGRSSAQKRKGMVAVPKKRPQRRMNRQQNNKRGMTGTQVATSFAAAAYSTGQRVREPKISASARSTRIVHRELLTTIIGSVAFANFGSYQVNPGIAATFPWLSTQASGWEQYRFHRLCFEYITRSATTAVGSVILAPDYDALDSAPSSELIATSYRDATEDVPWKDQSCVWDPLAMHPIGPKKYIRSGLVANADLKTYDVGTQHVCTTGQSGTDAIGKLWVCYDVEFFVPQTQSPSGPLNTSFAMWSLQNSQSLSTGVAATIDYDTQLINNMGIVESSGVFTLPLGNWVIRAEVSVSGATAASTFLIEIQKNGASFAVPVQSELMTSSGITFAELVASAYTTSTGTDTVRVRVTYTSATGTLVATANMNRVSFQTV